MYARIHVSEQREREGEGEREREKDCREYIIELERKGLASAINSARMCVCVCVRERVCECAFMCVCVCVREREMKWLGKNVVDVVVVTLQSIFPARNLRKMN